MKHPSEDISEFRQPKCQIALVLIHDLQSGPSTRAYGRPRAIVGTSALEDAADFTRNRIFVIAFSGGGVVQVSLVDSITAEFSCQSNIGVGHNRHISSVREGVIPLEFAGGDAIVVESRLDVPIDNIEEPLFFGHASRLAASSFGANKHLIIAERLKV